MGVLVIGATLTLVGNLLADVSYAIADPRLRRQ
jgi:peptide/nickel transport system permease protein